LYNHQIYGALLINDEQLLLFRKILNIRNYSESTINNYSNALIQFKRWNKQGIMPNKNILFDYVEVLKDMAKSYSYIKNSIMALMLFSELVLGKKDRYVQLSPKLLNPHFI